jgi:hypothetical protein
MNSAATGTAGNASPWHARWQAFSSGTVRAFHTYASWLVSISWRRFIFLSVLLLIVVGILHDMPPFTWTITQRIEDDTPRASSRRGTPAPVPAPPTPSERAEAPAAPAPPKAPKPPQTPQSAKRSGGADEGIDISIGKDGIRIQPRGRAASAPVPAASAASGPSAHLHTEGVQIVVPPGSTSDAVREAVAAAREEIEAALREARESREEALREAVEARREAERQIAELTREQQPRKRVRTTRLGIGDFLMQFTVLWVFGSALLKATYKGRMQAERVAARATETAEAESLRRQVVEARMAAMQAQVEPHFLFNTLASIDHLIETDPGRASQMQKNLIALLRASMPTLREAGGGTGNGLRDLGRELAVIRPYLEILKVRMEERLTPRIEVPEGLHSAEFPPMMIQTLVENAIKHGLEPKAEGGELVVRAEIVHGKLQVTVADTGLGFGRAATAGTGVGLANIRERLQLLYGPKATLTVGENQPSGTVVTITVPYKTVEGASA